MSNPAETYESYMVPALFGPWASVLVERANPPRGARVLDVATGTGIVARRVAERVGHEGAVVGIDLNPNMLAVARNKAAQERIAVDWREGRAETLPFENEEFDLVLCQFALMFFQDRPNALAEMRRVLRKGGRVVLSVFEGIEQYPFYKTLDDVIQRRLGMSGVQDIFVLGDTKMLRNLMERAGFENIVIESRSMNARFPDPESFLAGEIAVDTAAIPSMQHLDDATRTAIVQEIQQEMAEPLRAVTEGNEVVLPFRIYLVRAERH